MSPPALRVAFLLLALLCAALGLVPWANVATSGAAVPWWGGAVVDWLVRGAAAVLLALAIAFVMARRGVDADQMRNWVGRPGPRAFAIGTAAFATLAAAFLADWSFARAPFTSDEMAAQFHAGILRSGRLSAIPEQWPEFFNTAPVADANGRWFSQYPIGGPLLLALAGPLSWLVNPLLIGVATAALYRGARAQVDDLTARVAVLLFVTSPMVLVMAASQMNHVPALAAALIALAALSAWERATDARGRHTAAAVIGAAVGTLATIRPLDAAVVAIVIGAFQLHLLVADRRRLLSFVLQLAVGAVPLAALLAVNAATTGQPFLFGYEALNGPAHAVGFHIDPNGDPHTLRRGIVYVSGYLMRVNRYLYEWPLPAMLFVVAGLALHRPTRWTVVHAGLLLGMLAAYAAYWFDGFFAGPRFLFTAVPAFVLFTALALTRVAPRLRRPVVVSGLWVLVPLAVLWTWLGPGGPPSARERVQSYREQRTKLKTDVEAQVERAGLREALVFVNDGWRGRLQARLRVLGVSQFRAERLLNTVDACALQTALDATEGEPAPARRERVVASAQAFGAARPEPGLPADRAIALVPGTRPTPTCLAEFFRDTSGTMPYAMFLARQEIGADGRVGGNVVFARDLGARNALLRERFGNRTWYRYRPTQGLEDTTTAFVRYEP